MLSVHLIFTLIVAAFYGFIETEAICPLRCPLSYTMLKATQGPGASCNRIVHTVNLSVTANDVISLCGNRSWWPQIFVKGQVNALNKWLSQETHEDEEEVNFWIDLRLRTSDDHSWPGLTWAWSGNSPYLQSPFPRPPTATRLFDEMKEFWAKGEPTEDLNKMCAYAVFRKRNGDQSWYSARCNYELPGSFHVCEKAYSASWDAPCPENTDVSLGTTSRPSTLAIACLFWLFY